MTAGLVAHCDPGEMYNGTWFPTLIAVTDPAPTHRAGDNEDGDTTMSSANRTQLLYRLGNFLDRYVPALGKLL